MTDKGPLRISERAAELWWWSQGDSNPQAGSRSGPLRAGVPVIPVHSTRRSASLLVELDVHPRVTMQILRHSQIAVTMDI